jgi:putative cardiolipin synthase
VLEYFATPVNPEKLALHAKSIVVDDRWTFVGSPNLDPRSMVLNTEVGLVIDDRALAGEVTAILERDMRPANAWRVTLDRDGWLHWTRGDETLNRQPARDFWQRAQDLFLNLLPIKNQT